MIQLTEREWLALTFIVQFIRCHDYPPTIREIQEGVGYRSSTSAWIVVKKLKSKGVLTFDDVRGRTIRVMATAVGVQIERRNWRVARTRKISTRERVYSCIADFWRKYGYAPMPREISHLLQLSNPNMVFYHLHALRAAGRVEWLSGQGRTLRIKGSS